jgi:hypothetical protein
VEKKEPYTYEPHEPVKLKRWPWMICAGCGLLYLSNAFTSFCISKGCNHRDHPEYNRYRKLGGPFREK